MPLCVVGAVFVFVAWSLSYSRLLKTPFGLGVPEMCVLGVLAVILFGRQLLEAAGRLAKHFVSLRSTSWD